MFDTVPIPMSFASEIESVPLASIVQRLLVIDEKHGVVDIVFLPQIRKEQTGYPRL